jgi:hypothetical protein
VERLTSCATAQPVPEAFGRRETFLKLVDVLAHHKEALIRLANTRKRVEEGVREVIYDALRLFRSRWVCNVLVHYNVLGIMNAQTLYRET